MWTCLEVVPWGDSNLCLSGYQQSSSVVSGNQTWISNSGTAQQKQSGFHLICTSQQEWPGPARIPEVLCCASLNETKISKDKDARSRSIAKLAMQACHHCLLSSIYTLFKHVSSHRSCLNKTPCESVLAEHHMSLLLKHQVSLYQLTHPETSTSTASAVIQAGSNPSKFQNG
jgi:hypothetical protein